MAYYKYVLIRKKDKRIACCEKENGKLKFRYRRFPEEVKDKKNIIFFAYNNMKKLVEDYISVFKEFPNNPFKNFNPDNMSLEEIEGLCLEDML